MLYFFTEKRVCGMQVGAFAKEDLGNMVPELSGIEIQRFSIIISDIDHTLVDFDQGHDAAIKTLSGLFGREFADEVNRIFHLILQGFRRAEDAQWEGRQAFLNVIDQIKQLQEPTLSTYGLKPWSREAWILIAARHLKMKLTPQQVEEGRTKYWNALSNYSHLYNDAVDFLEQIQEAKIPLILITSSDSICRVTEDCLLAYDMVISDYHKRNRLKLQPIQYQGIVVGDPIDKPDPRFFDKVFGLVAEFGNFLKEAILVIGDSERNDLKEPQLRGYPTTLIKRD
jgi:FMN phosphatase YigB (HAD superfamily)